MVFSDHTACTDPGNIVGGAGGGVQAHPPQVFSAVNLIYSSFLKKAIIFQDSREGPTFSGGGGGQSKRIQITCDFLGWVRTPFPPLDPRMKTHSSDVLLMV